MLIDRTNLPRHAPWIVLAAVLGASATIWFFWSAGSSWAWPGGSSLPGITFGIVGGLIILFEFLFWPRKKLRTWRIGRAEAWLRAHIWLGLLTVPLLIYHSGFRLGGTLSTVLMVLFLIVIASGVFGLVLQQYLPTRMMEDVPVETIYSQIDQVLSQLWQEAEQLVSVACGVVRPQAAAERDVSEAVAATVTVGSIGNVGRVRGRVLQTVTLGASLPGAEVLHQAYERTIEPFLRGGDESNSALRSPKQAQAMFDDLRTKLDPAAHPTIQALEGLCEQRRQLDAQARLHFWMHCWLWVHLPLSAGLVTLMFAHVWFAVRYW